MALMQHPKLSVTIGFKNIQLFKEDILGIGSYGKVCRAKCDNLLCAAKIIHETLFDPTAAQQMPRGREHRLPIRRFEQECEFLNTIKHPNVIQYLGMWQDPDTGLPVLLMELMDDNLTHFLETATRSIPYHVQVNICHDIALALTFLHANGIIHRDLSSNNVLLISNVRAKVTDFGMAKLGDNIGSRLTSTMCPGTDVYMPPEAIQDHPVYTEKIDCFSFGVLLLQMLTREFPKPGDRTLKVKKNHPGLPRGTLMMCIPEVDRRQKHISQVDPRHILIPIVLDCLNDIDIERPSAQQLCERVAALKESGVYTESIGAIQTMVTQIEMKEQREQHMRELQHLQEIHTSQIRERDEAKQHEIQDLLQLHDKAIATKEREMTMQLEKWQEKVKRVSAQRNPVVKQPQVFISGSYASSYQKRWISIKLIWEDGLEYRAPCTMSRDADAIVWGSKLYLPKDRNIHVFQSTTSADDSWSQTPVTPTQKYSLVAIDDYLTTIGGILEGKCSNKLFSLVEKGYRWHWIEQLPPMPTKRQYTNALYSRKVLIVAGGQGESGCALSNVEILNIDTHQWCTADSLPSPTVRASMTLCSGYIYMLGGTGADQQQLQSVFRCSISTLLQSCRQHTSGRARGLSLFASSTPSVWSSVADLPVSWSTCLSFHKLLLAIGGNSSGKPTNCIYTYDAVANSWVVADRFSIGRHLCYAGALPNDKLVIVGGWTGSGFTDNMEIAKAE